MSLLQIELNGDNVWSDLKDKEDKIIHVTTMRISSLPNGTVFGNPSVAFRIDLPGGNVVIAETTLALLLTATDALKTKYGDPRQCQS